MGDSKVVRNVKPADDFAVERHDVIDDVQLARFARQAFRLAVKRSEIRQLYPGRHGAALAHAAPAAGGFSRGDKWGATFHRHEQRAGVEAADEFELKAFHSSAR
ncbi:hypothetical protein WL06_16425 [Burkholderia cepacia]|nr:hypothetical protein WL06_16425 [Burkholderia cepacia]